MIAKLTVYIYFQYCLYQDFLLIYDDDLNCFGKNYLIIKMNLADFHSATSYSKYSAEFF